MNGKCDREGCDKDSTHGVGNKDYCRRDAALAMASMRRCTYTQGPGKGTRCTENATTQVFEKDYCDEHGDHIRNVSSNPRGGAKDVRYASSGERGGAVVPRGGAEFSRGGYEEPNAE